MFLSCVLNTLVLWPGITLLWVDLLQSYFSLNFYIKNTQNLDQKVNPRQNTVCLKQKITPVQKIYTSDAGDAGDI